MQIHSLGPHSPPQSYHLDGLQGWIHFVCLENTDLNIEAPLMLELRSQIEFRQLRKELNQYLLVWPWVSYQIWRHQCLHHLRHQRRLEQVEPIGIQTASC